MTFQNWKELKIGGYDLTKLVRASDGLVIYEKDVGPREEDDYFHLTMTDGYTSSTKIGLGLYLRSTGPTIQPSLLYSYDKETWSDMGHTTFNAFFTPDHPTIYLKATPTGNRAFAISTGVLGTTELYPQYGWHLQLQSRADNLKIKAAGDIMSLIRDDMSVHLTDVDDYAFAGLMQSMCIDDVSKLKLASDWVVTGQYKNLLYNNTFTICNPILRLPSTYEEVSIIFSQFCRACKNLISFKPDLSKYDYFGSQAFYGMFQDCSSLVELPKISYTQTADLKYQYMFNGCTSLTEAPELPATTLAKNCYDYMFNGCTSLTEAPELPATTLANYCYRGMFQGCTSLTQAPELPATTLASYCYQHMFNGCTSLTQVPELPVTNLVTYCYSNMFNGCTSLTQAPDLPATTLKSACYDGMFQGCTSLVKAPELPATTLATYCYRNMFNGCTSLTEAPELPVTTLVAGCYKGMFEGCASLTQAPKIVAYTKYATQCLNNMFADCSSLSYIEVDMTSWPTASYMTDWVVGVAEDGIFKCPQALPETYATNRIPIGWTVVKKTEK